MTVAMQLAGLLAADAPEAPSITDWIEACATAAAAVGAFLAFGWQARALSQERKTRALEVARLDKERRDSEKAQARTIVLHDLARAVHGNHVVHEELDHVDYTEVSIKLGNYGSLPITRVTAQLLYYPTTGGRLEVKADPWESRTGLAVIPAGQVEPLLWVIPGDDVAEAFDPEYGQLRLNDFAVEIQYTDVNGNRWELHSKDAYPTRTYAD